MEILLPCVSRKILSLYGGENPPPPLDELPEGRIGRKPPPGPLIVKKDPETGHWLDGNGVAWDEFVTWDLLDNDLAVIDSATLQVSYVQGLMNLNMHLAPASRWTGGGCRYRRFESPPFRAQTARAVRSNRDGHRRSDHSGAGLVDGPEPALGDG